MRSKIGARFLGKTIVEIVLWVLFAIAVIVGVVWLVKNLAG